MCYTLRYVWNEYLNVWATQKMEGGGAMKSLVTKWEISVVLYLKSPWRHHYVTLSTQAVAITTCFFFPPTCLCIGNTHSMATPLYGMKMCCPSWVCVGSVYRSRTLFGAGCSPAGEDSRCYPESTPTLMVTTPFPSFSSSWMKLKWEFSVGVWRKLGEGEIEIWLWYQSRLYSRLSRMCWASG